MAKRNVFESDFEELLAELDSNISSLQISDRDNELDLESISETDDSDSEEADILDYAWCRSMPEARYHFPFVGNDGPKISAGLEAEDVLKIYEGIVNDRIISLICRETNKYALNSIDEAKKAPGGIRKRSKLNKWEEASAEEIRLLEGILLLMGIVQKPTFASYLTKNPLLVTPIFSGMMKEERFLLLMRFLHFSDSTDKTNKLYKIESLLNMYKESFQASYNPSRNISIDESLLLWKGSLNWKMYIPTKRARFKMECFMLGESETGYVWNFIIYTGKGTQIPTNIPTLNKDLQNHSSNVVLSLMQNLLDKGYLLGVDNYYSSVALFDYLVTRKTDAIGTF